MEITTGLILFGIALIGATIVTFWENIVRAFKRSILPWLKENYPQLADLAELAFDKIDKAVVAVRRRIKAAWQKIRKTILQTLVRFENRGPRWFRVVTSLLIKQLQGRKVIRRVEEEEVSYDDLPDEFREAWFRSQATPEQDVSKLRDQQIEAMSV